MMSGISIIAAGTSGAGTAAALVIGLIVGLAIQAALGGLMFYKVLEKGRQPGWAAFVPFYNAALLFKMSGKNPLLALLFVGGFIPIVGFICTIVGWIMLCLAVGKAFGKDGGFVAGLVLLGIVFFPILGFGSSRYMLGAPMPEPQGFPVMPPQQ